MTRYPQADPAILDVGKWDDIQEWLRQIGYDPEKRWITEDGIRITIDRDQHAIAHLSIRLTVDDVRTFPLAQ